MRKVTNLYLHTSLFVPGLGTLSDHLPDPHKTITDLAMIDNGAEILVTGSLLGKSKVSFGVPKSNIKVFTYVDEAAKDVPDETL